MMEKLILVDKDGNQTEYLGAFRRVEKTLDVVEVADMGSTKIQSTGGGTVDLSFRFVISASKGSGLR